MEVETKQSYFGSNNNICVVRSASDISIEKSGLVKNDSGFNEEHKPQFLNTRALSKASSTYELEKFKRNALIIINQKQIHDETMLHYMTRHGTEKDAEALRETFENFNFEIVEYYDYKKAEIFDNLRKFLQRDWSDYGCLAVAILTHGSDNGRLYARDQAYHETEIINEFRVQNNPSLITKPKVFIIQACRGTNKDPGVPVFSYKKFLPSFHSSLNTVNDTSPHYIPTDPDMLIVHSSTAGSVSFRDINTGSWFIQELCSKIQMHGDTTDLVTIITLVKREIAINKQHEEYNKRTGIEISKQMPVVSSTLLRKLYLRKFNGTQTHKTIIEVKDGGPGKIILRPVIEKTKDKDRTCPCCIDHFNYMKRCLKYYLDENPKDERARNFWDLANTLEDSEEFNKSKEKMNKIIERHLKKNAMNCPFFKYIYFNNH